MQMRNFLLGTTVALGVAAIGFDAVAQTAPAVRINGHMRFAYGFVDQDNDSNASTKLSSSDFRQEAEVDVNVEGTAANGIVYGAQIEIQFDRGRNRDQTTTADLDEAFLFLRSETLGVIQLGNNEGMGNQFLVGSIAGFATGGVDGDLNDFVVGETSNYFTFDSGDNTKINYRSPKFFGFDFGASFAFNQSEGTLECGSLSASCQRLSEADDVAQAKDIYELAARYGVELGSFGLTFGAAYIGSSAVDKRTPAGASFDGVSLVNLGVEATFAGLTVGGHYVFGSGNGGVTPLPSSGNNDDMSQYLVGAQYQLGAFLIGAHYFSNTYEGGTGASFADDREDKGYAVGVSYTLAPGLDIIAEYVSVEVKENSSTAALLGGDPSIDQTNKVFQLGARLSF